MSSSPFSRPAGDGLDPRPDRVVHDPRRGGVDEGQEGGREGRLGACRVGRLRGPAEQLGVVDEPPHRAEALAGPLEGVVREVEVGVERVVCDGADATGDRRPAGAYGACYSRKAASEATSERSQCDRRTCPKQRSPANASISTDTALLCSER